MAQKKIFGRSSDFSELRKQAEEKISQEVVGISRQSTEESERLVHELWVHQIELEMQNDELRKTQLELENTRDEFIDLYDFAPVGYFSLSEKGIILKANLTIAKSLGIERAHLINKPFSQFVTAEAQDNYYFFMNRLLAGEQHQATELRLRKKDGSEFYVQLQSIRKKASDTSPTWFRTTVTDITETKRAEARIKASLKEKETLLKEIHHRVKNNLNVIAGLLKLQANNMDDERLKNALKDSQNRVQSISMIHDTLYSSEGLSAINLNTYLPQLAKMIFKNCSMLDSPVNLKIDVEPITLGVRQASPLGLIINELISNSLKHAFPGNGLGQITIKVNKTDQDQIELCYSDSGIGMPTNFNWRNTKSLGLKLVQLLSEQQLNGSLELKQDQETCFIIKFKGETNGSEPSS